MTNSDYIFCKWKGRLWPATVLKTAFSRKTKSHTRPLSLSVEIFCLQKKVQINCTDAKPFEQKQVDEISKKLTVKNNTVKKTTEELMYRKALKIALDILSSSRSTSSVGVAKNKIAVQASSLGTAKKKVGGQLSVFSKTKPDEQENGTKGDYRSSSPLKTKSKGANQGQNKRDQINSTGPSVSQKHNANEKVESVVKRMKLLIKSPSTNSQNQNFVQKRKRLHQSTIKSDSSSPPEGFEKSCPPIPNDKKEDGNKREQKGFTFASDSPCSSVNGSPIATPRSFSRRGPSRSCGEPYQSTPKRKERNAKVQLFDQTEQNKRKSTRCGKDCKKDLNPTGMMSSLDLERNHINGSTVLEEQDVTPGRYLREQSNKSLRCRSCPALVSHCCSNSKNLGNDSLSSEHKEEASERTAAFIQTKAKHELPDFDLGEKGSFSSDLSLEFSALEEMLSKSLVEGDEEEEEELPSFLLQQEPCSLTEGMLVWCKFKKFPYWPAVVKSVKLKTKKASILFIDDGLVDAKTPQKGMSVSVRTLKYFDCEEKQELIAAAREHNPSGVESCIALIDDYRIRLGCASFTGSFTEYCSADISYPVRKKLTHVPFLITLPSCTEGEDEADESVPETTPSKQQPIKKVLPDRKKAARDKANEKLVQFIVKRKGADKHLHAIINRRKQSRWLSEYLSSSRHMNWVDTYLEDDDQLELVVNYLQTVCDHASLSAQVPVDDKIKFILDVLLPEAIVCAISAVDKVNYKKAEEKYMQGPVFSKREREEFDKQIEEKMKLKELSKTAAENL
ncbi:PWWP domain-containing DNA repair factor 3A [Latimeria chalumnae]|uniref:PWWP domain-containing DNA repair factor 3A n=1 Tax=Latimeria chalumnae TaxID=7897 RepID=UPI0003C13EB5|nr:PREDICTED: PWWP domain-containing protein MUM1 [Latimeria chalumnae]|eukprot:XP_014346174.1 PREDICTED: PWWP domain-containing protein MUM1 [Latimeria chalumnae]